MYLELFLSFFFFSVSPSVRAFEENLVKFKQPLRTCSYPKTIIERSLSEVNFAYRLSAPTRKKKPKERP